MANEVKSGGNGPLVAMRLWQSARFRSFLIIIVRF
jgi:hypothetical protein